MSFNANGFTNILIFQAACDTSVARGTKYIIRFIGKQMKQHYYEL